MLVDIERMKELTLIQIHYCEVQLVEEEIKHDGRQR